MNADAMCPEGLTCGQSGVCWLTLKMPVPKMPWMFGARYLRTNRHTERRMRRTDIARVGLVDGPLPNLRPLVKLHLLVVKLHLLVVKLHLLVVKPCLLVVSVTCWWSSITCRWPSRACWWSSVTRRWSSVTRRWASVTRRWSSHPRRWLNRLRIVTTTGEFRSSYEPTLSIDRNRGRLMHQTRPRIM